MPSTPYHCIVEFPRDRDRGRDSSLTPFRSACRTFSVPAIVIGILDKDIETYASGEGGQLLVDGIDFVAGELAYASVDGVLFWDVRGGHVSEMIWDSG